MPRSVSRRAKVKTGYEMGDEAEYADGVAVVVTTADGTLESAIARSPLEQRHDAAGRRLHDFPIVWVDVLRRGGSGPVRTPWPADAAQLAEAPR
jgi:hypothetical protein